MSSINMPLYIAIQKMNNSNIINANINTLIMITHLSLFSKYKKLQN